MYDILFLLFQFGAIASLIPGARLTMLEMDTAPDLLTFFDENFPCSDFAKEIEITDTPGDEVELKCEPGTPVSDVDLVMSSLNSPPASSSSSSSPESVFQNDEDSQAGKLSNGNCKKNSANGHKALKFPPCSVCGGKASGLHYGINSCEACKGFFRRYLLRNEEYKCSKGGNCVITSRHRGNCSGCRLTKCLNLGMSKTASRLGRYTLSRRTKTIMDVKELEAKEKPKDKIEIELTKLEELDSLSQRSPEKERLYTVNPRDEIFQKKVKTVTTPTKEIQEKNYIHNLMKMLLKAMHDIQPFGEITTQKEMLSKITAHYEKYKLKVDVFGRLTAIPDEEYYSFLKNYGIDLDGRWDVLKRSKHELEGVVERYVNYAKQIPGFASLSVNDQANLLKVARCDFFMILMHQGYVHEYQVFLTHNGMPYHLEEAADKFFSRELIISILEMYHRWQQLDISEEEMTLLISISLTFPDRCKLENRDQVEKIQYTMTELLNKCLVKRNKATAQKRFTKMIDLFVLMRDCSEQYYKEYKKLCDNELIIEEVPMMMELLLEDW